MTREDTFEDYIRRSDVGLTDFEIIMCNGDYREALKIVLEKIAKAPSVKPQKLKWISVDERLPERDVDVLAYVRGASFDYQRVMWIDDHSGKWAGYIGSGLYDKVIAWMPLPEPYKGGDR